MIIRRGLASAAASAAQARPNPLIEPIELKTSRIPNGMTVSSVDLQGAVSQLVFAFRSGSRYQQPDEGGLAHLLRNCIGTDSDNYLGIRLLWEAAQSGVNLSAKLSKDLHCIHMSVGRTQAQVALSVLGEIIQPAMKPWDILNVDQDMELDLKYQTPREIVIENLHRAAYRNGSLANPLLCSPYQIGNEASIGHKNLADYIQSRWRSADTALIGVNVDHSLLLDYTSTHILVSEGSAPAADPSPFLGGDVRQGGSGQMAHVAIVGQGAGLNNEHAVAIQNVLCALIGQSGQYTNYEGIAQPGLVHKAVHQASNHNPFQLTPLHITHSDNGLVGFYLAAEGSKIFPYVKAAVQGLRQLAKSPVDAETLQVAKQTLTVQIYAQSESGEELAMDQAVQILAKGTAQAPNDKIQLIQKVTAEEVQKVASQLCSKLALSAYGKIHQIPYMDEV